MCLLSVLMVTGGSVVQILAFLHKVKTVRMALHLRLEIMEIGISEVKIRVYPPEEKMVSLLILKMVSGGLEKSILLSRQQVKMEKTVIHLLQKLARVRVSIGLLMELRRIFQQKALMGETELMVKMGILQLLETMVIGGSMVKIQVSHLS